MVKVVTCHCGQALGLVRVVSHIGLVKLVNTFPGAAD